MLTDLPIPQAPDPIPEEEMWSGTPSVVLDGERYAIGWQRFPAEDGGSAYVTTQRGILGGRRVLERYPLTDDGWARAWAEFARLDPAAADKTRAALARLRAARFTLADLVLGAIDPPGNGFAAGQAYDLRYSEDGLQIVRSGSLESAAEYRYADVAAVQITGFEWVPISYWRGIATPEPVIRFHLRVQTSDRILDFWRRASSWRGEEFGRWLEPVNRAIRQAWLSAAADKAAGRTEWLVSELSLLAERLEHGQLARSDFDLLKARISAGY